MPFLGRFSLFITAVRSGVSGRPARLILVALFVIVGCVGTAVTPPTGAGPARASASVTSTPTPTPTPAATPSTLPTAAGPTRTPVAVPGLSTLLGDYAAGRPGDVDVAVYDAVSGATAGYRDAVAGGFDMASSVKLSILLVRLIESGNTGYLSPGDQALARRMIGVSDNDAASDLWAEDGGAAAMDDYFRAWGMTSTVAGTDGYWGLTTTTAGDQLRVLSLVAYPDAALSARSRRTADALLDGVEADQRWGVTAGVPAGASVEVKNGWLPRAAGWVVTSLGHVHGAGRDYVIAVLTRGGATEADNIATVSGLSAIAWKAASIIRRSELKDTASLRYELTATG